MIRDPVEVRLASPVRVADLTYQSLVLRPPVVRDLLACGELVRMGPAGRPAGLDPAAAARLVARLADIPAASVDALTASDFLRLVDAATAFFGGGSTADIVRAGFALGQYFSALGEILGMTLAELAEASAQANALAKAEGRR